MKFTRNKRVAFILFIAGSIGTGQALLAAENESHGVEDLLTKNDYVSRFVSVHRGYLKGYTKYHIDFIDNLGHGASELDFPIDNDIWGVTAGFTFKDDPKDVNNAAKLEFTWFTNVGYDAGKMKDSDWLGNDLIIYSESDASVESRFLDVNYFYNLYPDQYYSFGPKAGYQTIRLSYDITNVNQVGYGPYASLYTGSLSGRVIDYQVDYEIIYLGVNTSFGSPDNILCFAGFSYSPWTKAKDRDDHLDREKLSEADTSGSSYLFDSSVEWRFLPDWSLAVAGHYSKIHTTGTQNFSIYGGTQTGESGVVDDIISASWWWATAEIKYWF